MASSNDLIKYVTKEFLRSIEHPKEKKKRKRREPIAMRMFGMIPLSLQLAWDKVNIRRKKKEE